MKKIFVLLFLALLIAAGPVSAQKRLYFGAGGGIMNTWIINQQNYGLGAMDEKVTFGGAVNANIGFDFNKHIGLLLQIGYGKMGQNYTDTRKDTAYWRFVRLNYLQIPLMFKYRASGEVARFFVAIGPQLNYLLSAKQYFYKVTEKNEAGEIYNPINDTWTQTGKQDITANFNRIDICGRLDLGVEINIIKNLFINAGLSFGYGLMDINHNDVIARQVDENGNYNSSHEAFVGFNIGINYCFDPFGSKKK